MSKSLGDYWPIIVEREGKPTLRHDVGQTAGSLRLRLTTGDRRQRKWAGRPQTPLRDFC